MTSANLNCDQIIRKLRQLRKELKKCGVNHIDIFGSVARKEARPDSDVDLLIELAEPLGFKFFTLEQELSDLIGAPVELSTRAGMRPRVLQQAEKDLVRAF